MKDLASMISEAFYQHRQDHHGYKPKRLMLGRLEYAEFMDLGFGDEALGMKVTEEDCESMLIVL